MVLVLKVENFKSNFLPTPEGLLATRLAGERFYSRVRMMPRRRGAGKDFRALTLWRSRTCLGR
jgi:hypothetical protein